MKNTQAFRRLVVVDKGTLQHHKNQYIRIRAYMNRFVSGLPAAMDSTDVAFALFDPDGCLLKLVANDAVKSRLLQDSIMMGTLWDRENSGENAVSKGLACGLPVSTVGEENEWECLKAYAIYFAPILGRLSSRDAGTPQVEGGMAVIVPRESQNAAYNILVYSATNDLCMHMHLCDLYYHTQEVWNDAVLAFDINTRYETVTTVYHSSNIFETFDVPHRDIYFRPASELIDPLPQNEDFWSILLGRLRVQDREIRLRVQGKEKDCIVTTLPYYWKQMNMEGVEFLISTPQRRSSAVARHVGNNAVLNFDNIIGESDALRRTIQKGKAVAHSDSNIMLLGESGVGKDIFAQAIHNTGARKNKPFIVINCGALPRDLIASELFGYESGAFTGAKRQGNVGKFELANGGTLFLDEIGELPLDLQAAFLRAVEQKKITRLGGSREINVDVRIISATNVDLKTLVKQKKFRADLYYRLGTLQLRIPPLRDRTGDSVLLAEHFIRSVSRRIGLQQTIRLSDDAKQLVEELSWPGNVRELQNVIEAVVQLGEGDTIRRSDILSYIDMDEDRPAAPQPVSPQPVLSRARANLLSKEDILRALEICGDNRSAAAEHLGIARRTLYKYMDKYGI